MKIALIQQTASEDNESNIVKGLENIDGLGVSQLDLGHRRRRLHQ